MSLSRVQHAFAAGAAACALVLSPAGAGDLTPPAGPVAPTQKPLSEIEPRKALTAENTPGDANSVFRIAVSGSYYLTDHLSVPTGFRGIEIAASDVTIDLNGFTISQNISINTSASPIRSEAGVARVRVHNGAATGGYTVVNLSSATDVVLDRVAASGGGGTGIVTGDRAVIRRCTSAGHELNGFEFGADCVVEECHSTDNRDGHGFRAGSRARVSRCTASGNGIGSASTRYGVAALSPATNGLIENCYLEGNDGGISVTGTGWTVIRNTAKANASGNYSIGVGNHAGAIVANPAAADPMDNLSN